MQLNDEIKMKIKIVPSTLVTFVFFQTAQAVTPSPDGGYPGNNTAEGQKALFSLTTGTFNTAVGSLSLRSNMVGSGNTAIGAGTLLANTADQNTATGLATLLSNTTGAQNTANGALSLLSNIDGNGNNACGAFALFSNTSGDNNTADGAFALFANTVAGENTAVGSHALERNTMGAGNTAIGEAALNENTTGNFNTAIGTAALLVANGSSNTVIGSGAGGNVGGASNVICIGQGVAGANVSNSCYIASIWSQPGGSQAVYVNSDGKLGALVSSRRFKDDIQAIDKRSETVFSLHPVSFRYKKEIDPEGVSQFGLVAEEVEKVSPDLVLHDREGKPYSVRYDQVNAMMLNEFLKEHRKVQELQAAMVRQAKRMDALTNQLEAQAAQIQKIRGQVQISMCGKINPAVTVANK